MSWATAEEALALLPKLISESWRRLLLTGLVGGVLGVAGSFLVRPEFVTTAVFVPQTSGSTHLPASVAGLAAQFGVVPPSEGFAPSLFGDLPNTRYIREQVALARYKLPPCLDADSAQGDLIVGFGLEKKEPRKGLDATIRKLDAATDVKFEPITSTVTLSVKACSPELVADIASQYLAAIDKFDREVLRSQARAQREFAEQRVQDLARELSDAEDSLVRFYQANRTYQSSPVLQQRETKLRRQITVLESTYLTVRTEYERARMDEARDLPAITVVDPPEPPARKSWPKRWLFGLIAAALACAGLLGRELIRAQRRS
jgi:uncharacterized protein involved in exopolysaccharide biosynthesis